MNRNSRRRIFKDPARARRSILRGEGEGTAKYRRRYTKRVGGESAEIHCDATSGAGRIASKCESAPGPARYADCRAVAFDCTGATRYANSPLFPDRVLKAWAGALRGGRVGLRRAVSTPHIREH